MYDEGMGPSVELGVGKDGDAGLGQIKSWGTGRYEAYAKPGG